MFSKLKIKKMSLNLSNQASNRCYSFCTSYTGSEPYTIKLVHSSTSQEETQTIDLVTFGERVYFDIETTLQAGIGSYFIYANGVEVERGVLNIIDETEIEDIEYNG